MLEKRDGGILGSGFLQEDLQHQGLPLSFSLPVERTGEGAGLGVAGPSWAVWEARKVCVTVTQTRTLVFVLVFQLFWEAAR